MSENTEKIDIIKLSNELTYQRFLFNREYRKDIFMKMSIPEYIALQYISMEETANIYSGRTYLKDLADKLQMSIRQISKIVEKLRDGGFVLWSHDGNGSEGTYVTITENGRKLLTSQEEILRKYYGNVSEQFGKDNLIQLLQLMKQLETIMSSELERIEGDTNDDKTDE